MRLALELLVPLFFLWPLCTILGTCRPVTTEKLPFHTCRGRHIKQADLKLQCLVIRDTFKGFSRNVSHHESWYDWLLELGFEGVHQLFSFGVVERQNTWGNTSQTHVRLHPAFSLLIDQIFLFDRRWNNIPSSLTACLALMFDNWNKGFFFKCCYKSKTLMWNCSWMQPEPRKWFACLHAALLSSHEYFSRFTGLSTIKLLKKKKKKKYHFTHTHSHTH